MTLQFQWMESVRVNKSLDHLVSFKYVMFEELEQEFKSLNYSYTQKKEIVWNLKKIKSEKNKILTNFNVTKKLPFGKVSDINWWLIKKPDESKVRLIADKNS